MKQLGSLPDHIQRGIFISERRVNGDHFGITHRVHRLRVSVTTNTPTTDTAVIQPNFVRCSRLTFNKGPYPSLSGLASRKSREFAIREKLPE